MKKKILTMSLVLFLLVSLIPMQAFATEVDTTDTGTNTTGETVETEEALKAAIKNGGTIIVSGKITLTGQIEVSDGKIVKIVGADSNAEINAGSICDAIKVSKGELTLGSNLSVSGECAILLADNASIIIDGATVTSKASSHTTAFADGSSASIEVKSGCLESTGSRVALSASNGAEVYITGGTVRATESTALVPKKGAVVYIKGGIVESTSPYCAAYAKDSGKIIMSGGTVQVSDSGVALVAVAGGTVKIEGGTVVNGVLAHESTTASVVISGGTIKGSAYSKDGASMAITGGTFGVDPSAYVATDKYEVRLLNDVYTVGCKHVTELKNAKDTSCTETGYTGDKVCTVCNNVVEKGEVIAKLAHETELKNAKAASCTAEGYTGDKVCTVCNNVVEKGEVIAKLAHETELKNAKAASCTAEGYTGDKICKVCGNEEKGEVIAKLAHETELKNAKAASCTAEGYTGDKVCTVCKTVVEEGEVIEKLAHKTELKNAKDVSCATDGYTGDKVCKVCDTVVEKGEAIKAAGHTYENMVCTVCNDKMVVTEKVEEVDTSKPVEKVTPIVQQEAVDTASKETMKIVEAIISNNISEEVKAVVSEETINAISEAVQSGAQITTEIIANTVTEEMIDDEVVKEIKEAIGTEGTVGQYLDLSIMIKAVSNNGEEKDLGTLNELSEKIIFTIVIPDDLLKTGREFYILRVHNGVVEKLEVTKNMDGTYSFETGKFSTYALVYEDVDNISNESPKTDDMVMWMCYAIAVISLGVVFFARRKNVK